MARWLLALAVLSPPPAWAEDPADLLYANRAHLTDARRAAGLWKQALNLRPNDFDAAWKLARAGYWLGGHEQTEAARIAGFESGMDAANKAVALGPAKPDGHFWLAANMGGLAELKGMRAGLKYRGAIRRNLEKALSIDPAFQKGSADRALGRWYYKVPGLFGGSNKKSEEHLRKALTYDPQSIVTRIFLAETYTDMGRTPDAIRLLREIEALGIDPEWAPEDREFKENARVMLAKLMR